MKIVIRRLFGFDVDRFTDSRILNVGQHGQQSKPKNRRIPIFILKDLKMYIVWPLSKTMDN